MGKRRMSICIICLYNRIERKGYIQVCKDIER